MQPSSPSSALEERKVIDVGTDGGSRFCTGNNGELWYLYINISRKTRREIRNDEEMHYYILIFAEIGFIVINY